MKNIIITFLGMLFLSATMNAAAVSEDEAEAEAIKNSATYCVELPGHDVGNSGWTKRDNHVGARWKFSARKADTVHQKRVKRVFVGLLTMDAVTGGGFKSTKTFRGNWEGETIPDRYLYDIDHIWYSRGDRPLCVNYERLKRDLGASYADADLWIWLDVKYGGDCSKVALSQGINSRMRITKKPGDLVNPWSCKELRWRDEAWR